MPSKDDEIGAIWEKIASRSGDLFMSGRIRIGEQDVEVVIFRNTKKQPGEKTPDWRVYRSQPRDGGGQAPQRNAYSMRDTTGQPPPARYRDTTGRPPRPDYDLDDSIPF